MRNFCVKSLSAISKISAIDRYLGVVSTSINENSNYVMELGTLPDKTKVLLMPNLKETTLVSSITAAILIAGMNLGAVATNLWFMW